MVSIRAQTEFNCARGGRGGVVGRKTRQERANLQKNGFAGIDGTFENLSEPFQACCRHADAIANDIVHDALARRV